MGDWLKNAIMGAAVAENTPVMMASGWKPTVKGEYVQERTPESDQLAENLYKIGETAVTAGSTPTDIAGIYTLVRHPIQTARIVVPLFKKVFRPKQITNNNLQDLLNNSDFLELNEQAMKEARKGINRTANELRSSSWMKTASKHMSLKEAENLGKFESKLLDEIFPPKGQPPLKLRLGEVPNGALGETRRVFDHGKVVENRITIDPFQKNIYDIALHEGQHASTFNFGPKDKRKPFPEELQNALNTQMENAEKLANQLELDPEKIQNLARRLKLKGYNRKEILNMLGNKIYYLRTPQEARARGMAAKIYLEDNPSATKIPQSIDYGVRFFKDLNNNKLYKDIFSLIPTVGAFASDQLENGK